MEIARLLVRRHSVWGIINVTERCPSVRIEQRTIHRWFTLTTDIPGLLSVSDKTMMEICASYIVLDFVHHNVMFLSEGRVLLLSLAFESIEFGPS